jgi:glutamate-ammonia-ligase adenylyltransferase
LRLFAKHHLLDTVACEQLSEAYRTYRTETHRLALQNQPALVNPDIFVEHRSHVGLWWGQIMENKV